MHKRNIGGILKYGERTYKNPTAKLQAGGGFSAYAQGYNWREDPYELMLLQNKFKQQRANTYSEGLGSIGGKQGRASAYKATDIGDMPTLDKGLPGARTQANNILQQKIGNYYGLIKKHGTAWVKEYDAQLIHQDIMTTAASLNATLDSEEKQFNKSLEDYKDKNGTNLGTLAISTNNTLLVTANDDKGLRRVGMNEYLTNMDKYNIHTVSDFVSWKQNVSSLDPSTISEFLDNGAVSPQSVYETYVKPEEDRLAYKLVEGRLVKKGDEADPKGYQLGKVSDVRLGISNMMQGKSAFAGTEQVNVDNSQALFDAAKSIYGDILNFQSDRSRLHASLASEVLSNRGNLEKMRALGTAEERHKFLETQIAYTLLQKVVDKGAVKGSKSAGSSAEEKGDSYSAQMTRANASGIDIAYNNKADKWKVGTGIVSGEDARVAYDSFNITRGISPAELNTAVNEDSTQSQKENMKINENRTLNKEADTSNIFLEDGTELSGVLGGQSNLTNWLNFDAVLAQGTDAKILWLPTQKGKPVINKFKDLSDLSRKAREDYVALRKKLERPIKSKASELYPGNINKEKSKEFNEFTIFMSSYKDVKKLEEELSKDKDNLDLRFNLKLARKSKEIALHAHNEVVNTIFRGEPVTIQPYYMAEVYFDDDDKGFADDFIKMRKGKFGDGIITPIDNKKEKNYLQDVGDINNSNFGGIIGMDNIYKTRILMPANSAANIRSKEGNAPEMRKVMQSIELQENLIDKMSSVRIGATNDLAETVRYITNL